MAGGIEEFGDAAREAAEDSEDDRGAAFAAEAEFTERFVAAFKTDVGRELTTMEIHAACTWLSKQTDRDDPEVMCARCVEAGVIAKAIERKASRLATIKSGAARRGGTASKSKSKPKRGRKLRVVTDDDVDERFDDSDGGTPEIPNVLVDEIPDVDPPRLDLDDETVDEDERVERAVSESIVDEDEIIDEPTADAAHVVVDCLGTPRCHGHGADDHVPACPKTPPPPDEKIVAAEENVAERLNRAIVAAEASSRERASSILRELGATAAADAVDRGELSAGERAEQVVVAATGRVPFLRAAMNVLAETPGVPRKVRELADAIAERGLAANRSKRPWQTLAACLCRAEVTGEVVRVGPGTYALPAWGLAPVAPGERAPRPPRPAREPELRITLADALAIASLWNLDEPLGSTHAATVQKISTFIEAFRSVRSGEVVVATAARRVA